MLSVETHFRSGYLGDLRPILMNQGLNQKKTKESSNHTRLSIVSLGLDVAPDDLDVRNLGSGGCGTGTDPERPRVLQPAVQFMLQYGYGVVVWAGQAEEFGHPTFVVGAFLLDLVVEGSGKIVIFTTFSMNPFEE